MLRKLKIILYSLITLAAIALFAGLVREYDNNSIPHNSTIVEVAGWNTKLLNKWRKELTSKEVTQKISKKPFFNELKKFAGDENISLVKLRINKFNGHQSKIVYDFGGKTSNYSLYQGETIKQLTDKELQLEDTKGIYCTNANNDTLGQLLAELRAHGLKVRAADISLSPQTFLQLLLSNLSQDNLIVFLGIIGILFIVMVLEKVYRFKAYAVMKINGLSNRQIIKSDLKDELPLLSLALGIITIVMVVWGLVTFTSSGWFFFLPYALALLLIVLLGFFCLNALSYLVLVLIDPYAAIKGAENTRPFLLIGYTLKVLLLALIMANGISLTNHSRIYTRDTNIIKEVQSQKGGYQLEINWQTQDGREEKQVGKMAHQLVVQTPGVIVTRNSQLYYPPVRDTDPENGNVIIANNDFIKKSELKSKQIKNANNKMVVYVPQDRLGQVKQAKKQLKRLINFQNTLPNYYHKERKKLPPIEIVPIASGQRIFNYTISYNDILAAISTDPLIVLVNDKLLSDNFYLATISQKMVRFPNIKLLKRLVKQLGLSPYVTGITSQKALLAKYQTRARKQLLMLTLTAVLSFLQLLFIIVFVSSTFLQSQRRRMAIYRVFGKSNARLVGLFLLANLGLDLVIMALVLAKLQALSLLPGALIYLLIEALVILLTWRRAEHNLLTTLNHGN